MEASFLLLRSLGPYTEEMEALGLFKLFPINQFFYLWGYTALIIVFVLRSNVARGQAFLHHWFCLAEEGFRDIMQKHIYTHCNSAWLCVALALSGAF